jgi:putative isomerase
MAQKTVALYGSDLKKEGALHEYYNPDTGEPIINKGFQNWNYLVLNMIAWLEGRKVVREF